jgi:hypothetical protein
MTKVLHQSVTSNTILQINTKTNWTHPRWIVMQVCQAASITFKKRDNVRVTQQWGGFVKPLLPWKSIKYYIFWMCVFILALVIPHAIRIRRIVLPSVACLPVARLSPPYFSTLAHKWHDFSKKKLNIKCFDFLYKFYPKTSHFRTN